MKFPLKSAVLFCSLGLVAACTGTGTREVDAINSALQQADGNTAFVLRSTGYAGSAVPIAVLLNGQEVESLAVNEVGTFQTPPGKHVLNIDFKGIDLGLRTNSLTYVNDPSKPQYFVINLKQQFASAKMTISEVSQESFLDAVQN
ncbi:hypothetical protein J7426_21635 [Tropicibacter sp. R16_0]|uniref:hypothetical protein n=1 Tax=Tropicibacter sp. R16_0 TaxID=2821102 RepID=UPI001ADC2C5C|nr:hypothetical protein [Tropicibacter sp. R16_0]MBO9452880.1 hypothetical protein [Tropicibacter sp. R16_0]